MHASVRPAVSVNITPGTTGSASREVTAPLPMRMSISKLNFFYGTKQALFDISLGIAVNKVTALIGPSGCGKSTLLRTLNRMHETVRNSRLEGEILLDGHDDPLDHLAFHEFAAAKGFVEKRREVVATGVHAQIVSHRCVRFRRLNGIGEVHG